MLLCATNDAALRNKGVVVAQGGWRGGGRKLQGKKCAPLVREVRTSYNTTSYRRWNLNCGILRFLIMRNVRFNEIFMYHIVSSNDIW